MIVEYQNFHHHCDTGEEHFACCDNSISECNGLNKNDNNIQHADQNQQCYEYDMVQVGKPIEEYICCICFGIIRYAVEMPCCRKFIGNECRLSTLAITFKEPRFFYVSLLYCINSTKLHH